MITNLKTKAVREGARFPSRGTDGAAGLDLYCYEEMNLYPGMVAKIPTGIALEIPPRHYGLITGRSSTALKNVFIFPTVCDADYRGEVFITARYDGTGEFHIDKGDRIAQIVIQPYAPLDVVPVPELSETGRGEAGYGSTGR